MLKKKSKSLYDFNILSFEDKQAAVWEFGSFIENKPIENGTLEYLSLYGIDKFYVELVYNRDTNKIVEVHSFKTGKYLEKYLPNIETEY
jgi:hypothetical protein